MSSAELRIGCAGWAIPKPWTDRFPPGGSHLQRYACRFSAVEIDSSFYRTHKPETYARWAASVPDDFRFAIKVPKAITHELRLHDVSPLDGFLATTAALGAKRGPLLLQLPPSLGFEPEVVEAFLAALRERHAGSVVCEPRHEGWFTPAAERLLAQFQVARVAADPAVVPAAAEPGGWERLVYYRLHGSPRRYYTPYPAEYREALAQRLAAAAHAGPVWCIFDNTAAGAATADALAVLEQLAAG